MHDPTHPAPESDPVEDLLAACLEHEETEWEAFVDKACTEHPQHATTLRRRFARLKDTAGPAVGASLEVLPERLGEFRLLERLGGGGMGVVYLAEQDSLKRKVALKIVRPEHLYFQGARDRFRREVEAAARCRHQGIVPVYAVGEAEGIPYFAMEWIRGVSLGDLLTTFERRSPTSLGPLDICTAMRERGLEGVPDSEGAERCFGATWIEFCCRVVYQAAVALAHAHAQGVLHRDLKPSNLMLGVDGQVRIVDFGCSFSEGSDRLTRTGTELGSLPYMAPEQLKGQLADRRTDVYGLGVALYELFTLKSPYLQPDPEATRRGIFAGQPRSPRSWNAALSWDAETVCLVAMDRDPARRYSSMQDLAADLTRVLEHRPIVARRPGTWLRARRAVQRHPTLAVGILLTTLLVVFGPLALWWQAHEHASELASALTDVERLSEERVLADLVAEEQELWPMVPERLAGPKGMTEWLERAQRLQDRRIVHERDLEALRKRALPRTPAEVEADAERARRDGAEFAKLQARWEEVERDPSLWSTDAMMEIATRHRRLRYSKADRYTWRFERESDQWRHEKLVELITGIRDLEVLQVKRVRDRSARAAAIERKSLVEPKDLWEKTIAEIAADPLYHGLRIAPQRGFVPLGRDPGSKLHEFAHVESGEVPRRNPRTGKLVPAPEDNTCMVFVLLPGGKVKLGSAANDADAEEGPPYEVELAPFLIAKCEMDQAHWWNCFADAPASLRVNTDIGATLVTWLHPVETVSWRDAELAMRRLELTLPTEAQWEYAARGGTAGPAGEANFRDGDSWLTTSPVGKFAPNGFGIHDLFGNVAEWCQDRKEPLSAPPRAGDGLRDASGSLMRVVRGGSYLDSADLPHLTRRHAEHETNRLTWIGLRPVRTLTSR